MPPHASPAAGMDAAAEPPSAPGCGRTRVPPERYSATGAERPARGPDGHMGVWGVLPPQTLSPRRMERRPLKGALPRE